jgi:DNA recombination protein RmuC
MTETLLIAVASLIVGAGLAALVVFLGRRQSGAAGDRIADIARLQAETAVRVQAMGEMLAGRQAELGRAVNERLDAVTQRLGVSMQSSTQQTVESLQKLNERIAVIDSAQKNLTDLTSQVTSLREVFANKQSRGAFGQGRMETIVQDGLPKSCYDFQFTLSNRLRPDCCIHMPDKRPLVVDAKFPLESVTAYREAKSEDERTLTARQVRSDIGKHVTDIAGKYLIPGETQDLALMFVPSESVYAELYDGFDDIFQKAYRAKIVIVSPSLLMLAIQVIQQIQKDARMREAADQIHTEVGHMMKDIRLLGDRVRKLQTHFGQTTEDMKDILTSTGRIEKRGDRIREVEFGGDENAPDAGNIIAAPMTRKLEAGE